MILVAGLSTRVFAEYLPNFVSMHFGDSLWAAMIYCGFRVIGVKKPLVGSFILSMLFCIAIEFSQLYQADWINAIRDTVLGGLILGKGFLAIDLIRYTIGIMLIYIADRFIVSKFVKRK